MYHMIMLVLDNLEQCPSVLDAWEAAGVSGITILESTGVTRLKAGIRDDLPLLPSLVAVLKGREEHHRTLFTVLEGDQAVNRVIEATEEITGDLNEEHNGVLFVLPVSRALGVRMGRKLTA